MIYSIIFLLAFIFLRSISLRKIIPLSVPRFKRSRNMFVLSDQQVNSDLITVRFINTLQGQDVVVKAPLGENLLFVGDNAGVKLPRACRTGLCGSCTCEVKDPTIKNTNPNVPEGFATIRACSSRCYVPPGMTEMIVDVGRMKRTSLKTSSSKSKTETDEADDSTYSNPMARFSDDWEKEFRPSWSNVGSQLTALDPKQGAKICPKCNGTGRAICYGCNGKGTTTMLSGAIVQCEICIGVQSVGCGYCRGTGAKVRKSS